jgi:predicted O-methyltransferase YrrM
MVVARLVDRWFVGGDVSRFSFMLKNLLIKVAGSVAPDWSQSYRQCRYLRREARRLRTKCQTLPQTAEIVAEVLAHPLFDAVQRPQEITQLLDLLRPARPRRVLEIGANRCGTLFLFAAVAHPSARLLTIDLEIPEQRRKAVPRLAWHQQQVEAWRADSHAAGTLSRLRQWLAGDPLDFLFIDGDHSFDGVLRDFEMYGPLVRDGGIIAFHDIVPDFKTRIGIDTGANVGEVPRFWSGLKQQTYRVRELIADPEQDGMGIGILFHDGRLSKHRE